MADRKVVEIVSRARETQGSFSDIVKTMHLCDAFRHQRDQNPVDEKAGDRGTVDVSRFDQNQTRNDMASRSLMADQGSVILLPRQGWGVASVNSSVVDLRKIFSS